MAKKPGVKKKSALAEFFSWTFDVALVALLIWYFSSPQNQSRFWTALSNGLNSTLSSIVRQVAQNKPASEKQAAENSGNTEKKAPEPQLSESPPPPPSFVPPPLPTEEQFASEMPGDCIPPEVRSLSQAELPEAARLFYQPPPLPKKIKSRKGHGKPLKFEKKKIGLVAFYQISIDLNDPDSFLVIRLPKNSSEANSTTFTAGHETFETFVKKYPAAAIVNGTFFSKDEQERVMGNMVSEGKSLKYSPWENYGTTLGLRDGDYPEMVTCRAEGKPKWDEHWLSITCGPRLLKHGEIWLNPELEGFADPHVLGAGPRSALGFPKSGDKLYLITFLRGLTLKEEAKLMKEIGCYEAMNLDGGASKALSQNGNILMKPGRGLTNVLVVYDCNHKAPPEVQNAWKHFQESKTEEIDSASLSR